MIDRIKRKLQKKKQYVIANIAIKDCVHYCGFKYGGQQYNPYETFVTRYYTEPDNILDIKKEFIDFLRFYYPRTFNEAFQTELSKQYPLWRFPWFILSNADNWLRDSDDIPDILTHFSDNGIPSYKIDQEFYWLMRAINQIKEIGYDPEKFSYIEALKLENSTGESIYLLLDGNHRTSALHALGEKNIKVQINTNNIIKEQNLINWPNVKNGTFSSNDALNIFRSYFEGNCRYKTGNHAAQILNCTTDYSDFSLS